MNEIFNIPNARKLVAKIQQEQIARLPIEHLVGVPKFLLVQRKLIQSKAEIMKELFGGETQGEPK